MKTLQLNKKRQCFAMFALMLMFAMTITSILPATITPAYADTSTQEDQAPETNGTGDEKSDWGGSTNNNSTSGDYSMDALADKAESTLGSWKVNIVRICFAVFPIALIICLAVLFFTHDERKIAMTVKICITICIVALIILLVERNVVEEIIKNIANEL